MVEEKLEVIQKELQVVMDKERELRDNLAGVQELKFKYIGAIEVLQQMKDEPNDKKSEKK